MLQLGTVGISNALNSTLFPQFNFDPNRDLAMVAGRDLMTLPKPSAFGIGCSWHRER